jgi:AraC family transcriptional regulator
MANNETVAIDSMEMSSHTDDITNRSVADASGQGAQSEFQRVVLRPQFVVRYTVCAGCEFEKHSHAAYVVTAILSGQMDITVGASDYRLTEGDIVLTNAGQDHASRAEAVEFVSIAISPLLIGELVSEIGLTRAAAEISFRANIATDQLITAAARSIASEMREERTGFSVMLDSLVRQLTVHLLRSHFTVRKAAHIELSRAGPVDRRLRRAIEFMHDNYSRELMLGEIASAAYLSEYHFARLFKQIMGLTPHGYLAGVRLERARKLLAETEFPAGEIAAMVGYQSQSHFTKVFKSVTGLTPRAFRESVSKA